MYITSAQSETTLSQMDQAKTLSHACITTIRDANSSFLPEITVETTSAAQNTATKFVTKRKKYNHFILLLYELHSPPIKDRIIPKSFVLAYKSLFGKGPAYLKELLKFGKTESDLRPADAFTWIILGLTKHL